MSNGPHQHAFLELHCLLDARPQADQPLVIAKGVGAAAAAEGRRKQPCLKAGMGWRVELPSKQDFQLQTMPAFGTPPPLPPSTACTHTLPVMTTPLSSRSSSSLGSCP